MSGILVRQDIEAAIDRGELLVNADKTSLQACSYDLRIGTIFRDGQLINDAHPEANSQVIIQPGEIVSIFTLEDVILPDNITAIVFAINAQSSRGLLVLNPGHIDPGFKGPISVKALNLRKVPLALSRKAPIFTIIFEKLSKSTTSPYSKNVTREQRERENNERDVELAPSSLGQLISLGKDSIYPTRQEVREIVQQHWTTWLTLILTFIASLTGVISVFLAIGLSRQSDIKTNSQETPVNIIPKPSITP
jgi:deoxycytidine triphosphate deaminase